MTRPARPDPWPDRDLRTAHRCHAQDLPGTGSGGLAGVAAASRVGV